jgi:hypothetical protein
MTTGWKILPARTHLAAPLSGGSVHLTLDTLGRHSMRNAVVTGSVVPSEDWLRLDPFDGAALSPRVFGVH